MAEEVSGSDGLDKIIGEDVKKTVHDVLQGSTAYPPGDPTYWFCIRGRSAVVLSGAEVAAVLAQRVQATNHPLPLPPPAPPTTTTT